jgi:hypothetical protein
MFKGNEGWGMGVASLNNLWHSQRPSKYTIFAYFGCLTGCEKVMQRAIKVLLKRVMKKEKKGNE